MDLTAFAHFLERAYASESDDFYRNLNKNRVDTVYPELGFDRTRMHAYDVEIPEPILYIIAACDNQLLEVPYLNMDFEKAQFAAIFVSFEIIILLIIVIGVSIIGHGQKDFTATYDGT